MHDNTGSQHAETAENRDDSDHALHSDAQTNRHGRGDQTQYSTAKQHRERDLLVLHLRDIRCDREQPERGDRK